jgi:uncharacterized protein YcnI
LSRSAGHESRIAGGRRRALTRVLPALAGACCALIGLAAQAHAHAVVQPSASRPAEQQVYTLTVPSERDSDVVGVSMQVPADVESILVREAPGWRVRIEKSGDRVAVIRWSGGRIPADQYDSFQFIARNPVQEGELTWKIVQTYTDATDRWIGPPDSEYPAARTRISESASPVDAINTEEGAPTEDGGSDAGEAAPADAGSAGDGDSNTLPIMLGAVALAVGLGALVIALGSRRRTG